MRWSRRTGVRAAVLVSAIAVAATVVAALQSQPIRAHSGAARSSGTRQVAPTHISSRTYSAPSTPDRSPDAAVPTPGKWHTGSPFTSPGPPSLVASARTVIDPDWGDISSLSCPTESFCAGADTGDWEYDDQDDAGTYLVVLQRGKPPLRTPVGRDFFRVDCGSPTYCVAQDDDGMRLWNGTAWGAYREVAGVLAPLEELSCAPKTKFCVGIAPHKSVVYDNGSIRVVAAAAPVMLEQVSCAAVTFCMAAHGRHSYRFDGVAWTAAGTATNFSSIACPSVSFCLSYQVSTRHDVHLIEFDGTGWYPILDRIPLKDFIGPVCSAPDDCLLVSRTGTRAVAYTAAGVGSEETVAGASKFRAVSCVPDGSCLAVDDQARLFRRTAAGWSADGSAGPTTGGLSAVSCATASWCMAVDRFGNALQGASASWSAPKRVDSNGGFMGISCLPSRTCVAVDYSGHALVYRSGRWSKPDAIDKAALYSVSCATATRCVAVDYNGYVFTWDGAAWTSGKKIGTRLVSVDCRTQRACFAAGDGLYVLRDGMWTKDPSPMATDLSGISCPRIEFCVASTRTGFAYRISGVWRQAIAAHWPSHPRCISTTACLGFEYTGDDYGTGIDTFTGSAAGGVGTNGVAAIDCLPRIECVAVTSNSVFAITPT